MLLGILAITIGYWVVEDSYDKKSILLFVIGYALWMMGLFVVADVIADFISWLRGFL